MAIDPVHVRKYMLVIINSLPDPDPKFFLPFGPQFSLKIRGDPTPRALSPGSAAVIAFSLRFICLSIPALLSRGRSSEVSAVSTPNPWGEGGAFFRFPHGTGGCNGYDQFLD